MSIIVSTVFKTMLFIQGKDRLFKLKAWLASPIFTENFQDMGLLTP